MDSETDIVAGTECARARAFASLWLDGELSELEQALLDVHLPECAACRAFRLDVGRSTVTLREAPLEAYPRSIVVPRRGGVRRHAVRVSAYSAAVVAVVFVAATGVLVQSSDPGPGTPSAVAAPRPVSEDVEESHARRASLLAQIDRSWVPRGGSRKQSL